MVYSMVHTIDDLSDMLSYKEFFQLKYNKNSELPNVINQNILGPHQFFTKYFINPNNTNTRLLCKYSTGTGKSLASLITALQYLNLNQYTETGFKKIIILGFSKFSFIKELLTHPEFGFFTEEFSNRINYLRQYAETDATLQREYTTKKGEINKILKNKEKNIVFYGYKKLFLSLFTNKNKNNIWTEELSNYDQLYTGLMEGSIEINKEFLYIFNNSFIICDEIHGLYNAKESNNYGLALELIFNIYESPELYEKLIKAQKLEIVKNPMHILYLSATSLTTSPTEIIDLINLIVPLKNLPNKQYIQKDTFFTSEEKLLPNALKTIKELLFGYISYFVEETGDYPRSEYIGTEIPNVDYLKFERCEMTPLHYKAYKSINKHDTLNINDISILDGVIPNVEPNELAIYKNKEIISAIENNIVKYKKLFNLSINKNQVITGDYLKYENISKYSSKSKKLLDIIFNNLKNDGGKIIIMHQLVKYFGCLYIQELLLFNGLIELNDIPTSTTLCSICGKEKQQHKNQIDIEHFQAARFITIYGEMKTTIDIKLHKFRNNNVHGYTCRVLIGSQIIKQSYHFTEVQELIIMSMPTSYSEFIQMRGRAIRKNSHKNLPYEKQNVKIHILVMSIPEFKELSIEENKYLEKSNTYKVIQEIEKNINEIAVDNYLFYDYTKNIDELIAKPIRRIDLNIKLNNINKSMFSAFYNIDEIELLLSIIKYLFLHVSSIWKIEDLWNTIINPTFYIPVDTRFLDYNNFIIAISQLLDIHSYTVFDLSKMIPFNNEYYYLSIKNNYLFLIKYDKEFSLNKNVIYNIEDILVMGSLDLDPWNNIKKSNFIFNIQNFLYLDESIQMDKLDYEFFKEYNGVAVKDMPTSLEHYDIIFHYNNIQKIILYFINYYTTKQKADEHHNFYIKCLIFYTKLDLIIFADQLSKNNEYSIYSKYVLKSTDVYEEYDNPFLFSSQYRKNEKILEQYKNKKGGKILDIMLPVGHFLSVDHIRLKYPIIYDMEAKIWKPIYDYFQNIKVIHEKENDIIIGYFQVMSNFLDTKFKIRKPLHQIEKSYDTRLIEKGSICFTKTKEYLLDLVKKLSLTVTDETSGKNKTICNIIKDELIKRELDSVKSYYKEKKTNNQTVKIKWFYFQYESIPQP